MMLAAQEMITAAHHLVSVAKVKDSVRHPQEETVGVALHHEHGQQPGPGLEQGVCWMILSGWGETCRLLWEEGE